MRGDKNKRQTFSEPGHAHELTFSVYRRKQLMFEAGVVEAFLSNLMQASEEMQFDLWAYVVMPDHVHLLVYPREADYEMEKIRWKIKKPFVDRVFELHPEWKLKMSVKRPSRGSSARFWQQGPGYDRNMWTPEIIRAAIDYIHENPVRKALAESALDWPWSSARNYAGLRGEFPVVLYEGPC